MGNKVTSLHSNCEGKTHSLLIKNTCILIPHHGPSQGSNFNDTTRDCRLCLATFTNTDDRQEGAHHGFRTFCSPFKHATLICRSSLHRVIKSPHFMWHRLINRKICSVVNVDKLSKYSPLIPFSLKTGLYVPRPISSSHTPTSSVVQMKKSKGSGGFPLLIELRLLASQKPWASHGGCP